MNAWKPILFVIGLMAALPMYDSEGASSPCKNAVKGNWIFGQAPKGCDLVTDFSSLSRSYNDLTYNDKNPGEKARYINSMYAFLRDAADYYLDQRRRAPSSEERLAWRRAVMALAHQESYWTHFRLADDNVKFMRGDSGYGHGILQVDERWHPKLMKNGRDEDLAANVIYGLDMYFQTWEKAARAKCVSANNFSQRARAAYSAYNGGPGKICRWTKPRDKWARNDKGFKAKYDAQDWMNFVASADQPSSVNISCLVEGGADCGAGVGVEPAVFTQVSRAETNPVGSANLELVVIPARGARGKNKFV